VTDIHRLRWALLCVAATTGSLSASSAGASHTVIIGNGDSLDSLARRYHVPVRALAKANGITPETLLRNGRKIVIPDAPKTVVKEPTMRRPGMVTSNRIAIRGGPHENHRRLALVDQGYELVVTRKAGDWYQVTTQIGRVGWIRSDFVRVGSGSAPAEQSVARSEKPKRSARVVRSERSGVSARRTKRGKTRVARHEPKSTTRRNRRNRSYASTSKRSRTKNWTYRRTQRRGRPEATAPVAEADVVRMAYGYRGTPYRYGASGKGSFDCSGFTSYVYRRKGVNLPHNAAAQFGKGKRVKGGEMKPGDLVFFNTTRRRVSHVGIYAGEGKFVHASSGGGRVRVDSLNSGYYRSRLVGARRVK
jgi:cell wall-associated NlpC family hydrolase